MATNEELIQAIRHIESWIHGLEDLKKAEHYIQLAKELYYGE